MTGLLTGRVVRSMLMISTVPVVIFVFILSSGYSFRHMFHSVAVGDEVESHNGIKIFNNGPVYSQSHGRHFSEDSSCYYGKKWQCVEFVKRYYYDRLHHKMPNSYGHAKDFFNLRLAHGELNRNRGLLQFRNNWTEPPRRDDILVFDGSFGHMAIVSEVGDDYIEIVQQNIWMKPRQRIQLTAKRGVYLVGNDERKPLGWMRMP